MSSNIDLSIKIKADSKEAVSGVGAVRAEFTELGKNAGVAAGEAQKGLTGIQREAQRIAHARDLLGIVPHREINQQIEQIRAAYQRLAASGKLTGAEMAQAAEHARVKINDLSQGFNGLEKAAAGIRAGWLAVTGALVGVAAAAKGVLDAGISGERIAATYVAITGSATAAANEMNFLRGVSERLGLNLSATSDSYTKLLASSRGSRLEGEETRKIFTAVSTAASVLGLSTDTANGAFLAISQMMSKGVISAEEFRGQFAERIPGALGIAAKGLGVTEKAFVKMLDNGELLANDVLPKIAQGLMDAYGPGVAATAHTTGKEIERLHNAWTDFQRELFGKGSAGLSSVIEGVTAAVKSLKDNVEAVATAIRLVGEVLVMGALGAAGGKVFASLTSGALLATRATTMLALALKATGAAAGGVLALGFLAGWEAGKFLVEWFDSADKAATKNLAAMTRLNDVHVTFNKEAEKLRLVGFSEAQIGRITEMKQAVIAGKISFEEGLAAAQKYALGMVSGQAAAREAAISTRDALVAGFKDYEKALDASLKKQDEYAKRAKQLSEELLGIRINTADRVSELRRKDMDEAGQQADIQNAINDKLAKAHAQLAAGDTKSAEASAGEVQRLGERLKSTDAAVKAVEAGGKMLEKVKATEIAAAEELVASHKKGLDSLKRMIDDDMKKLIELDAKIRDTAPLKVDNSAALRAIDEVLASFGATKRRIENDPIVQRVVTVTENRVVPVSGDQSGDTGGSDSFFTPDSFFSFAGGGRLQGPGTPTSDSILMRGSVDEYVVKASSAQRVGYGVLDYINRMGDLPKFADGGRIGGGASDPVAQPSGGGITIQNLNLPGISNASQFVAELRQMLRTDPNLLTVGVRAG
jgi:tape measure domain-containing protein